MQFYKLQHCSNEQTENISHVHQWHSGEISYSIMIHQNTTLHETMRMLSVYPCRIIYKIKNGKTARQNGIFCMPPFMQERKGGELKEHIQTCQQVHIVEKHMIRITLSASGKGPSQGRSKRDAGV